MLVTLGVIVAIAKLNVGTYKGILILAIVAGLLNRAYTAFLITDPDMFRVYSQDWVSTVIAELTGPHFPILGKTAITYGSVLYLISSPLQVTIVILSVAGLLHTTSLGDILSVLSKVRTPFPIIFVATVSLKFVPQIVEEIRLVRRAQSLRGWTLETHNPVKKVLKLRPLLFPVLRSAIKTVDVITMSSQNRAFGTGTVTPMADFSFRDADKWICIAVLLLTIAALCATLTGSFGSL
jgi:energy-coupling factor transporter transmembrane protein EcfT